MTTRTGFNVDDESEHAGDGRLLHAVVGGAAAPARSGGRVMDDRASLAIVENGALVDLGRLAP
jgi:hypothetical protein